MTAPGGLLVSPAALAKELGEELTRGPAGQPGPPDQEPADDRKPCSCSEVHVTTREAEVLCALAGGSTSRQAANAIASPRTSGSIPSASAAAARSAACSRLAAQMSRLVRSTQSSSAFFLPSPLLSSL